MPEGLLPSCPYKDKVSLDLFFFASLRLCVSKISFRAVFACESSGLIREHFLINYLTAAKTGLFMRRRNDPVALSTVMIATAQNAWGSGARATPLVTLSRVPVP